MVLVGYSTTGCLGKAQDDVRYLEARSCIVSKRAIAHQIRPADPESAGHEGHPIKYCIGDISVEILPIVVRIDWSEARSWEEHTFRKLGKAKR